MAEPEVEPEETETAETPAPIPPAPPMARRGGPSKSAATILGVGAIGGAPTTPPPTVDPLPRRLPTPSTARTGADGPLRRTRCPRSTTSMPSASPTFVPPPPPPPGASPREPVARRRRRPARPRPPSRSSPPPARPSRPCSSPRCVARTTSRAPLRGSRARTRSRPHASRQHRSPRAQSPPRPTHRRVPQPGDRACAATAARPTTRRASSAVAAAPRSWPPRSSRRSACPGGAASSIREPRAAEADAGRRSAWARCRRREVRPARARRTCARSSSARSRSSSRSGSSGTSGCRRCLEVRERGDERRAAGHRQPDRRVLQSAPGAGAPDHRRPDRQQRGHRPSRAAPVRHPLEHGLAGRGRPAEHDRHVPAEGRPVVGLRLPGPRQRLRQAPPARVAPVHVRRRQLDDPSPSRTSTTSSSSSSRRRASTR